MKIIQSKSGKKILRLNSNDLIKKEANQNIQISHSELVKLLTNGNQKNLENYLYESIRRQGGWQEKSSKVPAQVKESYNKLISSNWWTGEGNPEWSQKDIQKGLPQAGNDWKLYFSPTDESLEKFVNTIASLYNFLKPVAAKWNTNLDYKIPNSVNLYLAGNDRLVVHFGNKDATNDIRSAVTQWASKAGVSFGSRTHSLGQDGTGKNESWGVRVAKHISQLAIQHMQSKKYNAEQVAQWIEKYIGSSLSQVDRL